MAPRGHARGGSGRAVASRSIVSDLADAEEKETPRTLAALQRAGFRPSWLRRHYHPDAEKAYDDFRDEDFIKEWWRTALQDSGRNPDIQDPPTLEDVLYTVGFSQAAARDLAGVLGPLWDDIVPDQLVDIAVDYALGRKYRPMRPRGAQYPYNSGVTGVWFTLPVQGELHRSVRHYNLPGTEDALPLLPGSGDRGPQEWLLYHATAWRFARSIINDGPRREHGRPYLDFGNLQGFYVTPNADIPVEWAHKRRGNWHGECAVLVFRATRDVTNAQGALDVKMFDHPNVDWQRLTRASRECKDEYNELDRMDAVVGPMVANPVQVTRGEQAPQAHRPPKLQLATKSDRGDAWLQRALVGVVWIKGDDDQDVRTA